MEKTFREVIATIKTGEVWENYNKKITCHSDGIQIYHKDKERYTPSMLILDEDKFTLRIKEYIFEEAFREYEKGDIEIESKTTGNRFKKVDGNDMFFSNAFDKWSISSCFIFRGNEIRGMWYIKN